MDAIEEHLKIILTSGVAKAITSLNDGLISSNSFSRGSQYQLMRENKSSSVIVNQNQLAAVSQSWLVRANDSQSDAVNQNH